MFWLGPAGALGALWSSFFGTFPLRERKRAPVAAFFLIAALCAGSAALGYVTGALFARQQALALCALLFVHIGGLRLRRQLIRGAEQLASPLWETGLCGFALAMAGLPNAAVTGSLMALSAFLWLKMGEKALPWEKRRRCGDGKRRFMDAFALLGAAVFFLILAFMEKGKV